MRARTSSVASMMGAMAIWGCGEVTSTGGSGPVSGEVALHRGAAAQATITPASIPVYADLIGASGTGTAGSLKLDVETGGPIPRFPDAFIGSVAVFGYGWVDADTGNGIVATIHPVIGRDSHQNPDGWHTHPVILSGGAAYDFCIEGIGTSQGGLAIQGARMRLNISARQAGLAAGDLDVAAAFVVRVDAACATTGLGVEVLDALTL